MIKLFESFNEIKDICEEYNIRNYTINSDESINVNGNVNLSFRKLDKIPLKFNKVSGNFNCAANQLKSLEGSPKEVGGNFQCNANLLTSLEHAPVEVSGHFWCQHNKLTSLEGAPKSVRIFSCENNEVWTFDGAPNYIEHFWCNATTIFKIWELFEDYSKVELFNYYDIIREVDNKPAVVLERLNDFLEEIGKDPVKNVKGYLNI